MERTRTLDRRLNELEATAAQSESELVSILSELGTSPITLEILKATKIGLTVNRVRRAPGLSQQTNQQALALIREWKELAMVAMPLQAAAAAKAAAAAAAAPAPSPSAAPAASPPTMTTAPLATTSTSTADNKRKIASGDRDDAAKKAKLSSASSLAAPSPPAATPSPVSPAAPAASSARPPPLALSLPTISPPAVAPLPAPSLLFNPNLAFYRAAAGQARQAAANASVIDHTSRKKTGSDSHLAAYMAPSTPSAESVSLCSLETMCCDHIAAHLDKFAFLDSMPVPAMLRALAKASAEQLTRFEKANPRLLGETEGLWKQLCKKAFPTMREAEVTGTWKHAYTIQGQKKNDKLAAVSERLRAMQQNQAQQKSAAGIKAISQQTAVRIESQGKRSTPTPAAAAVNHRHGAYTQVNKLSKLKADARAASNMKYSWQSSR